MCAGGQHVHEPGRKWLGKSESGTWQDVRRSACLHSQSANRNLYAARTLYGVKLLFRWERAHASPVEPNGEERTSTFERQTPRGPVWPRYNHNFGQGVLSP